MRRTGAFLARVIVALMLVAAALEVVAPAAAADTVNPCHVLNKALGIIYEGTGENLHRAIDEASDGGTLHIRGACVGYFSIDKSLTLIGHPTAAHPFATLQSFTPNSHGFAPATVLTVSAGTVTLRRLTITRGSAGKSGSGGGIYNAGTLRLTGACRVSDSSAGFGGGIFNANTAILRLEGGSVVSGNRAVVDGGGIDNEGQVFMSGDAKVSKNAARVRGGGIYDAGDVTMNGHSSVRNNRARSGGGGVFIGEDGVLTMNDASSVARNLARVGGGSGGGILSNEGTLTMNDASTVSGNKAVIGGGIANFGIIVTMNGASSVSGNTALVHGGGIYNDPSSALVGAVDGVNVVSNLPDNIYRAV